MPSLEPRRISPAQFQLHLLFMRLAFLAIALILASCAAPATSYYMLSSEGPAPSGSGIGIGVGPVKLAGYLDRPNLVLQEPGNQLSVSESHRWAGDLGNNISRITAANLGRLLNTGNVRSYPWDDDRGLRYQIALDIHHLHGNAEGDAVLEATWRIYSIPDKAIITSKSWSGTEPLKADGFSELVAAQDRLLARLAREIATGLKG
jgi:uncharacterized protein